MKRIHLFIAVTASALLLVGCTSLKVVKVGQYKATLPARPGPGSTPKEGDVNNVRDEPGIRYSLPKPVLQITRATDGTITADIIYLPDSTRTYAVSSSAVLANSSLTVGTENGLLKKVSWTGDGSGVAGQAVESASGAILQHGADIKKGREDAKKKTDDAAKDNATKVAAAQKAVADQELALLLAQSDYDVYNGRGALADVLKAEAALAQAKQKLARAQAALAELSGTAPEPAPANSGGPADSVKNLAPSSSPNPGTPPPATPVNPAVAPGGASVATSSGAGTYVAATQDPTVPSTPTAPAAAAAVPMYERVIPGSVLYTINETDANYGPSLKLQGRTAFAPASDPPDLKLYPTGLIPAQADKSGRLVIELVSNTPLVEFDRDRSHLELFSDPTVRPQLLELTSGAAGTEIKATFTTPPPGKYRLLIQAKTKGAKDFAPLPTVEVMVGPMVTAAAPSHLLPRGMNAIRPDKEGNMVLTLSSEIIALDVDFAKCRLIDQANPSAKVEIPGITLGLDGTEVKVILTGTPPGRYRLDVAFKGDGRRPNSDFADITVLR